MCTQEHEAETSATARAPATASRPAKRGASSQGKGTSPKKRRKSRSKIPPIPTLEFTPGTSEPSPSPHAFQATLQGRKLESRKAETAAKQSIRMGYWNINGIRSFLKRSIGSTSSSKAAAAAKASKGGSSEAASVGAGSGPAVAAKDTKDQTGSEEADASGRAWLHAWTAGDDLDVVALAETKIDDEARRKEPLLHSSAMLPGHTIRLWACTAPERKRGYAGVAVFIRDRPHCRPIRVLRGVDDPTLDLEGRVLAVEF